MWVSIAHNADPPSQAQLPDHDNLPVHHVPDLRNWNIYGIPL